MVYNKPRSDQIGELGHAQGGIKFAVIATSVFLPSYYWV